MKRRIAFFSSDARPQYKADIFNAICLPKGYIIHFRYGKEYIKSEIFNRLTSLRGLDGVIFFSISEDHDLGQLALATKNISIRDVTVCDVFYDPKSDLVHFFLRLDEFKDYTINSPGDYLPPKAFVSDVVVEEGPMCRWRDRVDAIKGEFPDHLFVNVSLVDKANDEVLYPVYVKEERETVYELQDEKEFVFDITFMHTGNVDRTRKNNIPVLTIEDRSNQVQINSPNIIDIGTLLDNRRIRFVTKSAANNVIDSFMIFQIVSFDQSKNECLGILQTFIISARIKKQYSNILLFAVYSVLGVLAIACVGIFSTSIKDGNGNYTVLLFAIVLTFISSAMLYKKFNKSIK